MPGGAAEDKPLPAATGRLPGDFLLVAGARLVSNVALRLVFPFLPRIAAGLGVSLSTMGTALALRELAGMAAPALGRGADRIGHPRAMALGLAGLAVALVLGGSSSGLLLFTIALVAVTVAKSLFDVASAAWVGAAVPFRQRGRAIGLLETSWALAFIVAMPIAALLIRLGTWRTPFLVFGAVAAACAVQVALRVRPAAGVTAGRSAPVTWTTAIRYGIAAMVLLGLGHQMLIVTFATFLEDEHDISLSGLGLTALVIGVAELAGSGIAAASSDTLGKTRSVEIALAALVPASLLVSFGSRGLVVALALLALWFVLAELALVSMLTLFSELDRAARGTVMGLAFAGWAAGHAAGALVGSRVFERYGMGVTGMAMAGAYGACLVVTRRGVEDPSNQPEPVAGR